MSEQLWHGVVRTGITLILAFVWVPLALSFDLLDKAFSYPIFVLWSFVCWVALNLLGDYLHEVVRDRAGLR